MFKNGIPPMYGWSSGGAGTITLQVSTANDDGRFYYMTGGGGGDTDLDADENYQGRSTGTPTARIDPAVSGDAYVKDKAYFRFPYVDIAKGTVIQSAYLEVVITASTGSGDMTVVALDTDNASNSPPSTSSSARDNHTSASVTWSNPLADGTNHVSSPDIKTVIQEIVNRAGWSSGNAILMHAVFLAQSDRQTRTFSDYSANPSRAAKLVINT